MANRWRNSGNSGRLYFGGAPKSLQMVIDSILKSRDITLSTKVHPVKAMVFPIVMYGCESWTIKKAESWRIDAFELWCWRRILRDPWTARRSNQSILKEISPEYSLEGLMLKLKLQYFGHLMQRADSFEKTLMLRKIEGGREGDDRGRDGWMASPTQWTWVWVKSRSWWWTGRPGVLQSLGSQRIGHDWSTNLNWTDWTSSLALTEFWCLRLQTEGDPRGSKVSPLDLFSACFWASLGSLLLHAGCPTHCRAVAPTTPAGYLCPVSFRPASSNSLSPSCVMKTNPFHLQVLLNPSQVRTSWVHIFRIRYVLWLKKNAQSKTWELGFIWGTKLRT